MSIEALAAMICRSAPTRFRDACGWSHISDMNLYLDNKSSRENAMSIGRALEQWLAESIRIRGPIDPIKNIS